MTSESIDLRNGCRAAAHNESGEIVIEDGMIEYGPNTITLDRFAFDKLAELAQRLGWLPTFTDDEIKLIIAGLDATLDNCNADEEAPLKTLRTRFEISRR